MNPKIEALIEALGDFSEAAMALERAWLDARDEAEEAMAGYPFARAFEEETFEIVTWCRKASAKLAALGN
jgi:hypothetical protein